MAKCDYCGKRWCDCDPILRNLNEHNRVAEREEHTDTPEHSGDGSDTSQMDEMRRANEEYRLGY